MTNAQILQQSILYDFLCRLTDTNPLSVYTDSELMKLYRTAQDEQDGRKIKAIHAELNRRSREQ